MNCKIYRELLSSYVDDQLPPPEALTLMDHLSGCRSCRDELGSLLAMRDAFNSGEVFSDEPAPSTQFVSRVMDALPERQHHQPARTTVVGSKPIVNLAAIRAFLTLRPAFSTATAVAGILLAAASLYIATTLGGPDLQRVSDVKSFVTVNASATADDAFYNHARLEAANTVDGLSFAAHPVRGETF